MSPGQRETPAEAGAPLDTATKPFENQFSASRAAQGLPAKVTDPDALRQLAQLLTQADRGR